MWCDATATTLLASIFRGDFVIAMVIMYNVLLITKQLSVSLQQVNIDLTRCWREIKLVVDVITQMRNVDVKVKFGKIFNEAEKLLGVGDAIKRTCSRQTYRGNAGNVDTARAVLSYNYTVLATCLLYQYNVTATCHRMLMTLKHLFCDGRCDGETCQLMIVRQIAWIVWLCVTNSFFQTSSLLYPSLLPRQNELFLQ